jgi:hypothetical protein
MYLMEGVLSINLVILISILVIFKVKHRIKEQNLIILTNQLHLIRKYYVLFPLQLVSY